MLLRIILLSLFVISSSLGIAQVKLAKLILDKNEKYFLKDVDVLFIDTLVMGDSSAIILNPQKRDNTIHSKVTIIGSECVISGIGVSATKGKIGTAGIDQAGPCVLGKNGSHGSPGHNGQPANNLFLYLTDLTITGSLTINLNGGDGGDGGDGGVGGGGGPGTRVCAGGNGGSGGSGGHGGNGGHGGTLNIQCDNCPTVRGLINRTLTIKNYGGYAGNGGNGGFGGPAGLGPVYDGLNGKTGNPGKDGQAGKNGAINFISN